MEKDNQVKMTERQFITGQKNRAGVIRIIFIGRTQPWWSNCFKYIPELQPKGAIMWAPGNVAYYDISSRVHAIPGSYKMTYDIGGLMNVQ